MDRNTRPPKQANAHLVVAGFAVVTVAIVVLAFVTTLNRVEVSTASNDVPPGTIGLAHPHPPLERGPGEPTQRYR